MTTETMTVDTSSRAATRRTIESFFYRLSHLCERSRNFNTYHERCAQSESEHRRWGRNFREYHPKAFPASVCSKHFVVRYIMEHLVKGKAPSPADVFDLKLEIFQAWALLQEFRKEITDAFSAQDAQAYLDAVDYVELVSPGGDA